MTLPDRRFRVGQEQHCPMCGGMVMAGAANCRNCGADLMRAGVVLSSVVTPISRKRPRTQVSPRALSVGLALMLVGILTLSHVRAVSARIPFLRAVGSATDQVVHLVFSRSASRTQPLTPAQQPPTSAPSQGTDAPGTPADPIEASVTILSDPAGAKVLVDSTAVGTTPLILTSLTPGSHEVKVQRAGYVPVFRTFTVDRGETITLNISLTAGSRSARKPGQRIASAIPDVARRPLPVGARAPAFVLKDRVGVLYRLQDMQGHRVAILFVWNLDPQARTAIREIDFRSRRAGGQFNPLVVVLTPDRVGIRGFVTGERIGVPVLFGNSRTAELYGISYGVPAIYVLSAQGTVMRHQAGAIQLASVLP